jgi:diguanylate cyclase (GGDEF)-like protein
MDFQLKYELVKLTCSIGVAVGPEYGNDFHSLYVSADEALYQAKNSGKNKISIKQKL